MITQNSEIIKSLSKLYNFPNDKFKPYFRTNVCAVGKSGIIEQLLNKFGLEVDQVDFIRLQMAFSTQTFVKSMADYDVVDYQGNKHEVVVVGVKASKKKLYRWFRQNRNRFLLKHAVK